VVIAAGTAALKIEYSNGLSLGDVIQRAAHAAHTPDRRCFAALIIHALSIDGLIPSTSDRSDIDRNVCALAESALPEVLDRFKYPFRGQAFEKRRALEGLHARISELLHPLATPPNNLPGLVGARPRLMKCLTDRAVEPYFGASGVRDMCAGVQRVFEALAELRQPEDAAEGPA
jgi:hypothetical protein